MVGIGKSGKNNQYFEYKCLIKKFYSGWFRQGNFLLLLEGMLYRLGKLVDPAKWVYLKVKTKEEHIIHWANQSSDDWESAELLFKGKKYLHALFFAHLSIEKICKAHWVRASEGNIPPKTHNLIGWTDGWPKRIPLGVEPLSNWRPLPRASFKTTQSFYSLIRTI